MNGDYKKFSTQQIFDVCYKESLHSQEAFDEMNNDIETKINEEQVHENAEQIPGMLKNKIIQKKEANFERLNKRSLVSMLFGKSRDALVLKFI